MWDWMLRHSLHMLTFWSRSFICYSLPSCYTSANHNSEGPYFKYHYWWGISSGVVFIFSYLNCHFEKASRFVPKARLISYICKNWLEILIITLYHFFIFMQVSSPTQSPGTPPTTPSRQSSRFIITGEESLMVCHSFSGVDIVIKKSCLALHQSLILPHFINAYVEKQWICF